MGAPRWPPNPPTFGTSRQSRDVPLSRALAWPPSRIYLHGGREMARNPPTFGTSRQSRDVPLSPRWPPTPPSFGTYWQAQDVTPSGGLRSVQRRRSFDDPASLPSDARECAQAPIRPTV